jgi:hypothetical protein
VVTWHILAIACSFRTPRTWPSISKAGYCPPSNPRAQDCYRASQRQTTSWAD